MTWDHATELKERIARFDDAIAGLKRAQQEIVAQGPGNRGLAELDERLIANRRTLEALERSRELALEDLSRLQSQRDRESTPRCVVVDENQDGRLFLSKTLLESFPRADIIECDSSEAALLELGSGNAAVFLVHRATDADGLPLVEMLRAASAKNPIIYISGVDRTDAALAAGATTFLQYDKYRLIGQIVRDILRSPIPSDAGKG